MTIGLSHPPSNRKGLIFSIPDRRGLLASFHRCFQNYYHGHKYLNPSPQYISNVRSSVNHWQLRDKVQIDASTGYIYHTLDENIRVLLMKHRSKGQIKSRNYLHLPYRPRCFSHAQDGLVVTGGVLTTLAKIYLMSVPNLTQDFNPHSHRKSLKGLFSIYTPSMTSDMSFQLGEMINNCVTIYPQANSTAAYTSYACNNDSHLYVVDVSDSGIKGKHLIVCEPNISLNNVHQSPDGRVLTATGDSGSIYLIDPSLALPVTKTIKTTHDSGFGISYHNNDLLLAAAFQDGTCSIYDLRWTDRPLHEINSTRPGHQSGAFRTCKFLNSSIQNLLVVLEHVGRVHLVDLLELSEDNHQVVVYPFALDQFSRHKNPPVELEDEFDTDIHQAVDIFNNEASHFTAPLVYDYEYVTDVNPKLFKDYVYEPPQSEAAALPASAESQEPNPCEPAPPAAVSNCNEDPQTTRPAQQPHELYRQSINHVNGEMEILGFDWYDNKLYIAGEEGGILAFDVNVRARRSFGSFSYV